MKIVIVPSAIETFCQQMANKVGIYIAPECRKGIYLKDDKIFARSDTYPYIEVAKCRSITAFCCHGKITLFVSSKQYNNKQIILD